MNEEAVVVNLFFTFRVFLVGAMLLALPRITRKGLVFGVYLGEQLGEGAAVARLERTWDRSSVLIMVLSLIVGFAISLGGHPVRGNLTGTVVLILASVALLLAAHYQARRLAAPGVAPEAMTSVASLEVDEASGDRFARLALAICVFAALASAVQATLGYQALPARVPTLAHLFGQGVEMTNKSIVTFLLVPSFNLVLSFFMALTGVLVAGAKRSVRAGSGGGSREAQNAFRTAMAHLFSGSALFLCGLLTVLSVELLAVAGGRDGPAAWSVVWIGPPMILYILGSLVRMSRRLGQGGALLEAGSTDAPLVGSIADNSHWILGMTYVNRDDPSLIVESRFFGYTYNLGHRVVLMMMLTFWVVTLGLVGLTLRELGLV